jgi:eukaryotic-like serine/threonine-protein kinase
MNALTDPARAQQIKELFQTALELAADEREQFLHARCADDQALRAAVQELLLAHAQAGDFLQAPPFLERAHLAAAPALGQRLGPYRLLEEIGRGGMATVYLAVRDDDEYQQQVAIKLLWPSAANAEVVRRFRQERQILANLAHPSIARLLDGGVTAQGTPYLVMEYIAGLPLTRYCAAQGLSLQARLQLFQSVCAAVAYAHRKLVIHRDLKPSNILVTQDGVVKLLDFGIAKLVTPEPGGESRTRTGLHWMTPEYASPEQLREEALTTASDVYSLGVLLYELLTGVRPHPVEQLPLHELMRVVSEAESVRPSQRAAERGLPAKALRGDLDNIVLMALRKAPRQRYQNVEQLSEDLHRYLTGQPVSARPATLGYRTAKYLQRHRVAAAVAATFLLMLLLGLVIALWQLQQARARERLQRRLLYAAQMRQAGLDLEAEQYGRVRRVQAQWLLAAGGEDLRGFEWHYLWRRVRHGQQTLPAQTALTGLAFTRDGRQLIAADYNGQLNLWQTAARAAPHVLGARGEPLRALALAPDERRLVTGDAAGRITLWDWSNRRMLATGQHGAFRVLSLAFAPDSQLFASGGGDGTVKLWEARSGRELTTLRGHRGWVEELAFSPDGRQLFTSSLDGTVKCWDVRTGQVRFTLNLHNAGCTGFALAPAGQVLAIGGIDRSVQLWRLATPSTQPRLLHRLPAHEAYVYGLAFSPDGQWLATGSTATTRLWEVATGRLLATLKGAEADVAAHAFSPDGQWLAAVGGEHAVRLWRLQELFEPDAFSPCANCQVHALALAPDGQRLAIGSDRAQTAQLQLWDLTTQRQLSAFQTRTASRFDKLAFAPAGAWLAAAKDDLHPALFALPGLQPVRRLSGHSGFAVLGLALSPTGQTVATGGEDHLIRLWDTTQEAAPRLLQGHQNYVTCLDYSPDGRRLVSGSFDRTLKLWDSTSGQVLRTLSGHTDPILTVRFSPGGDRLVSGGMDRLVKLWDAATGQLLATRDEHAGDVLAAAFHPAGSRFATASADRTVRLWDATTGELLLTLKGHSDQVHAVVFAHDGQTLFSGSLDKTVRLWRAAHP